MRRDGNVCRPDNRVRPPKPSETPVLLLAQGIDIRDGNDQQTTLVALKPKEEEEEEEEDDTGTRVKIFRWRSTIRHFHGSPLSLVIQVSESLG